MNRPISAFSWGQLPRASRTAVRGIQAARRAVARAIDPAGLGRSAAKVSGAEVAVVVHEVSVADCATAVGALPLARVALRLADESALVLVGLDPTLATEVMRRVIARPSGLDDPRAPWSPALQGALEALVLETARGAAQDRRVAVAVAPVLELAGSAVLVRASVLVDGRPYAAGAVVHVLREIEEVPDWTRHGDVSVSVPLVVGVAAATLEDLEGLSLGDAWSCGGGWMIDSRARGRGVLVGPDGERGALVELADDGSLVILNEVWAVPLAAPTEVGEMSKNDSKEVTAAIQEAVTDAPMMVRVELGQVTLLVREWAALQVGDVIATHQRVGEPVRLRVAGREVGRGELVNIEGELGVKITSLGGSEP